MPLGIGRLRLPITIILTGSLSGCFSPFFARHDAPPSTDIARTPHPAEHIANGSASPPVSFVPQHAGTWNGAEERQAAAEQTPEDLWDRLRQGLSLEGREHPDVRAEAAFYAGNQRWLAHVEERAAPFLFHIVDQVEQRGMPLEVALLPIIESAFHPLAHSPSGAAGIWQFMPATGRRFGLPQNNGYDGRKDVIASTRAALDYLERLLEIFDGDWLHALAAYNVGERNVSNAIAANRKAGKPTDFFSLSLPAETRVFVPKLLAIAELVAEPERHGITWTPIPNRPAVATVALDRSLDLNTIARLAGLSVGEIKRLNPGLKRHVTPAGGGYALVLPAADANDFASRLARLDPSELAPSGRHQVRRGETLGQIAQRYGTTVAELQQINGLQGTNIRAGRELMVPGGAAKPTTVAVADEASMPKGSRSPKGVRHRHVVRPGDNLWLISRDYKVSIQALCAWNDLTPKSVLQPGQTLTIWLEGTAAVDAAPAAELAAAAPAVPQATGQTDDTTEHLRYQVQSGDSLWLIAQRFGVTVADLRTWNQLPPRPTLQPGQELDIFLSRRA